MNTELARFSSDVDMDRVNRRVSFRQDIADANTSIRVLHECKYRYCTQFNRGEITRDRYQQLLASVEIHLNNFKATKLRAEEGLEVLGRNR